MYMPEDGAPEGITGDTGVGKLGSCQQSAVEISITFSSVQWKYDLGSITFSSKINSELYSFY